MPSFYKRGDGGDVVCSVDELVEGLYVLVHLLLPLLKGGKALFMIVHCVPQGGVVVVVLAGGEEGTCEEAGCEE